MLEGMGNRPSGDPKVRAKDIFSTIDVNQDGTLTKDEFIKGLCLITQNEIHKIPKHQVAKRTMS